MEWTTALTHKFGHGHVIIHASTYQRYQLRKSITVRKGEPDTTAYYIYSDTIVPRHLQGNFRTEVALIQAIDQHTRNCTAAAA